MTVLLVASAGGHLTELMLLQERLRPSATDDYLWVSDDDPHARSALQGEPVVYAHGPTRRSAVSAARNYWLAREIIRQRNVGYVVSTGAALSVPFLIAARLAGVAAHYVECATRVDVPSLSGRILERIPGVSRYTQHETVRRHGWIYAGSVYDAYSAMFGPPRRVRTLLVVLGTQGYPFTALVERVRVLLRTDDEVIWQLGATPAPAGLPGRVVNRLPADELEALIGEVDVVVGHAGSGLALSCLAGGATPVLAPRRAAQGEHVDDHQRGIASLVERRGLAVVRSPARLGRRDLEIAAGGRVVSTPAPVFNLVAPHG